jgi:hypothetical protein
LIIAAICARYARAPFSSPPAIAIFAAVTYATVHASNYVTDFVLSRFGPFNVRFLFIYGTFTAFAITVSLLAWRPNRLPFALKAMALFLLVRAVFVALTHMAPSPIDPQAPAPFFNSIFYGSDLFFSGHTGLPLLAALAFWHMPQWRMFYLALTAFFGTIVLLGHYHYSIDVLAALFITHGVFRISCWLFSRDYLLFRSSENQAVPRPRRAIRRRVDKWVEARGRKRPTSVPVGGVGLAPEPFVLHAVAEGPVPSGRSNTGA